MWETMENSRFPLLKSPHVKNDLRLLSNSVAEYGFTSAQFVFFIGIHNYL